ncbi:MAG: tripartite tricarboxylate transporter TctB family protein [Alphaproteobacteria bacterium]|nr:tripartite tricarboxylate transporter TctB family protein [Alphaproteobacteria bacterium]
MSRRVQENLLAGVLLCFFIGVLVLSLDYGPRARLVPIPISVLALILLGAQIVWQNLRPADELHVDMLEFLTKRGITPGKSDDAGAEPAAGTNADAMAAAGGPGGFGREAFAFAKVGIFVGLFLALGPFPAAFLFTFAYFSLSRHYHWARALVYTTIFTAVVYGLFVEVLDIQLYHGLLEPLMNSL